MPKDSENKNTTFLAYSVLRRLILPLDRLDEALPNSGSIYDLGCGQGLIAAFLSQKSSRDVVGVDSNFLRLQKSNRENLKFIKGDITKLKLKNATGIVISDVLHHLTKEDQKKLLKNTFKFLKKGGVLAIKEIDTSEFIRSKLSRMWDFILYPKEKINFNSASELKESLKGAGYQKIEIERPCRFFPGSTTLFICTK